MMASRILIRRSLLSPTLITASPKRMALRSLQTMAAFDIDQYRTDSPPPALQSTAPHPNIVNKSIPTNVSTSTSPSLSLIDDTVRQTSRPHEDWTMSHPVYTRQELDSVKVVRREAKTVADRVAILLVRTARWGFDFVTRYKHDSPEAALATLKREGKEHLPLEELRRQGYVITVDSWLRRILFLEAVAGVPGMVAAVARHLRSLRLMQRDNGWIATLLSEAENERVSRFPTIDLVRSTSNTHFRHVDAFIVVFGHQETNQVFPIPRTRQSRCLLQRFLPRECSIFLSRSIYFLVPTYRLFYSTGLPRFTKSGSQICCHS